MKLIIGFTTIQTKFLDHSLIKSLSWGNNIMTFDFNYFDSSYPSFNSGGLEVEGKEKLKEKVVRHRNEFYHLFVMRYIELIPTVIKCLEVEKTSIDYLKTEIALRNNRFPVIGKTANDKIMLLGFVRKSNSVTSPLNLHFYEPYKSKDIEYIIPDNLVIKDTTEITNLDDCESGTFVVLRNKTFSLLNDFNIIYHYAEELAEIITSRFSLSIQAKVLCFFKSEIGDETINQVINDIYDGNPFIKVSNLFDVDDSLVTVNNATLAANLTELKREYQNKVSELNNMLGINSLAVDKESGVSDTEAKSNRAFTTSIANIYLSARQEPLNCLNKRFGLNLKVVYNDAVISDLELFNNFEEINNNG